MLMPLEGERWIVTLVGRRDVKPPGTATGSWRMRGSLALRSLNAIRQARRLSKIVRFGFPASTWRHFERLKTFPRGVLPFGDAICRFNPAYGQGMSVAAQEALLLRRLLGNGQGDPLAGLAPAFFAEVCRLLETPWMLAAVPDFAFPEIKGDVRRICNARWHLRAPSIGSGPEIRRSTNKCRRCSTSSARQAGCANPLSSSGCRAVMAERKPRPVRRNRRTRGHAVLDNQCLRCTTQRSLSSRLG